MKYPLRRQLHSSWMIAVVCVSFVIGVAIAPALQLSWLTALSWLLTGVALSVLAIFQQRILFIGLAIIGGLVLGLWRGSGAHDALMPYQTLIGHRVTIHGIVSDDSDVDKRGNPVLRLKSVSWNRHDLPGMVWISLATKQTDVQRSDLVEVRGQLSDGFGTFAATMYRASLVNQSRPQPGDVALHVRDWFASSVRQVIPEPEASLGVGYLVGQRRNLPADLDTALRTAGLMHIVVASGYNLTILVRLCRRLFEKISKYLAALTSTGLILGFMAVTGASPSMSRAGLVAGLSLLAWYYGRKFHPMVILAIALATTVLINPAYAWGDVGWQLSFAAFAGVMLLAPLLQAFLFGETKPGIVRQVLGETIAAWLCTLPILLLTFGYMSNVAIIANLLILPLIPLAMLLTFIAGVGALAVPAAATIMALPATWLLGYMTHVALWTANLSWAKSEITISALATVLTYAAIIGVGFYMWRKTRLPLRDTSLVA